LRGGLSYLLISQKRANPRGVWYYRGGGVDAGRGVDAGGGRYSKQKTAWGLVAVGFMFSGGGYFPRFRFVALICKRAQFSFLAIVYMNRSETNDDGAEFLKAIRENTKNYPAWQVFTFAEFVAIREQFKHETGAACVIRPRAKK